MRATIHNPEIVSVSELTNHEGTIAITIKDGEGGEVVIFSDYKTFFNLSQILRQGGTYGNEYNLKTGEKTA